MLKGFAADLFFPGRCAVCDEVLSSPKDGICSECRKLLQYIEEPRCMKCGKGLLSSEQEYCFDCGKEERSYICGFPLLNYVSPVRESLARMKYDGRQEYDVNFFVGRTEYSCDVDMNTGAVNDFEMDYADYD